MDVELKVLEQLSNKIRDLFARVRKQWKLAALAVAIGVLSLSAFIASRLGYYEIYYYVRALIYLGSLAYFIYYYLIKKLISYLKKRRG